MDVDHFNTLDAKRSVSYSHYTFPGLIYWKKNDHKNSKTLWFTRWYSTSMLVTDVGDEMYWWQRWDVGDRFEEIDNIIKKSLQNNDSVTIILNLSPS